MATKQTSKNRVHLFRLQTLIIDGGLLVLRNILDQKLNIQNISLSACLSQERSTITRLKGQTIITQVQYDLLYPAPGGQPPSTADFDITLIICLLRNLKACGLNRKFNWNIVPNSQDVSVEADIYRLKMYRNEISHIAKTTGIDLKDFRFKWTEIEKILLRLSASVINPVPSLQQTIDDLKTNPLDEEAEERIQKEIKQWRKLEKGVEVDLRRANLDTQAMKEKMKQQQKDVQQVESKVEDGLRQVNLDTQAMKEEMKQQQKDVQQVESKVEDGLRKVNLDTQAMKEEMKQQQKDVRQVEAKVEDGLRQVNLDTQAMKEDMKQQQKKYDVIYQRTSELMKDTQNKVADLEKQIPKNMDTIEKQKEQKELNIPDSADRYECLKKQLKDDLVTFYKDRHSTIPLSPLFEEHDTPLVEFYVLSQMNEVQKTFSRGEEIKTPVKSLSDVFKKGNNRSREIYLTADAGFGKTAFSKYLAVTWCQAHRPDDKYTKYFSEDIINAMREYEFLFLVLLRDSSDDCSIDDLIVNQIVQNLSRSSSMTISSLQEILHSERCLVILDGLDEWTHTEKKCSKVPKMIPHRNTREKCTVLTTTRPWKFSVISLKASQVDKKVELVELTSESAQTLKERAISKIKVLDIVEAKREAESLNEDIEENGLENLESVPLLLMYLICLWCDDIPLGQSKCGLYTSIIELLLSRTMSKHPEMEPTCEPSQSDIPQCFSEQVQCKKNCTFLKALGKLALKSLMSEKKENSLVFDYSFAEKYLSPDHLKLSLLSGILTQSKQVKLTTQSSKVSFSHKSVQEYFCALYMSCQNESDVKKIVLQNCSSVENILDMSTVFVFISGMNAKMISSISGELMPVISEDKITRTYRSRTDYDPRYVDPVIDIQNMYISCLKENPGNNDLKLRCQDFIINDDCREESYFTNLKQLAIHNKNNMQSILIENEGICSLHEIIESCEMADLSNIRKIYYQGECKEEEVCRLLDRSVECVTVISSEWQDDHFIGKASSCSSELCKTFQNNSLLQAIHIDSFQMKHQVLEQFVNYIVDRKSMAEIKLYNLYCIRHDSCPGFNLDFTQHSHLSTLGLYEVPVQELEVNVTQLVDCYVGQLSKPGIVTSLLRALPAASQLQEFVCSDLESSGEIEVMLETLPKLVTVKEVGLRDMNLGERSLSLSPEMLNIECVRLYEVTMTARTLRDVVSLLQKLPHTVTIYMVDCNIRPKRKFEQVKQFIQTSHNFRVTFDEINRYKQYAFEFETIKS